MRPSCQGHTAFPAEAFLIRGLPDVHAAFLRERKLVPHDSEAYGRKGVGADTEGASHAGIIAQPSGIRHSAQEVAGLRLNMPHKHYRKCGVERLTGILTDKSIMNYETYRI